MGVFLVDRRASNPPSDFRFRTDDQLSVIHMDAAVTATAGKKP
jgi:hypothetical protein